jgi:hypothetical protein
MPLRKTMPALAALLNLVGSGFDCPGHFRNSGISKRKKWPETAEKSQNLNASLKKIPF